MCIRDRLKEKAKELGMSINEYLSGIFVYSIYKGYLHGNVSKKPIVLCVPVNLRPFFGSMTTRNFFAMASASFLPEKEKYERQEVMKLVQACLLYTSGKPFLCKQVQGFPQW